MSLPELALQRLDVMPKVRPRLPALERARGISRRIRYSRNARLNGLADARVLSRLKPFYIDSSALMAPRDSFTIYKNVHVFEAGTKTIFRAKYVGTLRTVNVATVRQSIGKDERVVKVIFPGPSYYECDVPHEIAEAGTLKTTASITWRLRGDVQTKNYEVGLFDFRDKPVSEYPVSGADNAELTIAYEWREGSLVYPPNPPAGLSFTDMSLSAEGGFCEFKGRLYKDPQATNLLRLCFRVINNTGATVTLKFWGAPFSVLYEDSRHVSQVNIDMSVEDRTIPNGGSTEYSLTVGVPGWAYGRIAPAIALKAYKDGMLIYGGGPFFQKSVGRLILP